MPFVANKFNVSLCFGACFQPVEVNQRSERNNNHITFPAVLSDKRESVSASPSLGCFDQESKTKNRVSLKNKVPPQKTSQRRTPRQTSSRRWKTLSEQRESGVCKTLRQLIRKEEGGRVVQKHAAWSRTVRLAHRRAKYKKSSTVQDRTLRLEVDA